MRNLVTPNFHARREASTQRVHSAPAMQDEATLQRIEAMLMNLRDQLDELTERVDVRMAEQRTQLVRLRREFARLNSKTFSDSMLVRHHRPFSGLHRNS